MIWQARQHEVWQDISFLNSLIQEALQPRFPEAVERWMLSTYPHMRIIAFFLSSFLASSSPCSFTPSIAPSTLHFVPFPPTSICSLVLYHFLICTVTVPSWLVLRTCLPLSFSVYVWDIIIDFKLPSCASFLGW